VQRNQISTLTKRAKRKINTAGREETGEQKTAPLVKIISSLAAKNNIKEQKNGLANKRSGPEHGNLLFLFLMGHMFPRTLYFSSSYGEKRRFIDLKESLLTGKVTKRRPASRACLKKGKIYDPRSQQSRSF